MAQKVNIVLVDDLDGGEADETVSFGYDGNLYEIDLSTKNSKAFFKMLEPYMNAGRRTQARRGRPKGSTNGAKSSANGTGSNTRASSTRGRKRVTTVEDIEKAKQDA